ncbi:MAG: type VI-B CRISPR-associated RNA-guided ribonuclease Cas13b, partial [Rhodoferax sp.]|nr:type VI-B CRISPR-associated RNA-guided ribonuclease Cas13b [Rhodoferax sp.]
EPALKEKLKQFFNQPTAKSYYTLLPQDLPTDLLNLLLRQAKSPDTVIHKQAENTLRLLMEDGEERLAQVQAVKQSLTERTKPGKPGHRVLRAGEMATFLAKDMLRFQPVQDENSPHKGKPTSIMADLLQARLAYFGRDKTSLPALFNSLHLTGNEQAQKNHPFLQEIQINAAGMNGIAQFYEAYLQKRKSYLQGLQHQLSQAASVLRQPAFAWLKVEQAGKRLQGKDDVAKLVTQYLDRMAEPLNLPRGLFRELTVHALKRLGNADLNAELQANLDKEAGRGRFTSPSILVALYFLHVQKDASQDFYYDDMSRLDKRFDDLYGDKWREMQWAKDEVQRLQQISPRLTPREVDQALQQKCVQRRKKMGNFKHDLDRTLSHRASQDQVLFLAARQLIDLDTKRNKGTQQAGQDGATETMFDKLRLQTLKRDDLNQMVPHEVCVADKTIFDEQVKAKNIGRFKSLARDRRLPGVLHYYPEDRIPANLVAHELQAYPRAQNQAMEDVLAYEDVRNAKQKLQASDPAVKPSLHCTLMEQHLKQVAMPHETRTKLQDEALTLR